MRCVNKSTHISLREFLSAKAIWRPFYRLLPFMRPYWFDYILLFLFMMIDIGIGLFLAWFVKNITEAATHQELHRVLQLFVVGIAACLINGCLVFVDSYLTSKVIYQFIRDLKMVLFDHILRLPMRLMGKYHSGDLMSRLTTDIENLGETTGNTLLNLIRFPLTAAASFVYVFQINWKLSLICLAFAPVSGGIGVTCSWLVRKNSIQLYDSLGKIQNVLQDSIAGQAIVRAFQFEKNVSQEFKRGTKGILKIQLFGAKLQAGILTGSSITGFALYLFSMGIGAIYISKGILTVGALLAFITLIQQLVRPLMGMSGQIGALQKSMGAAERVWSVLDEPIEMSLTTTQENFRPTFRILEWRHVSFSYDGITEILDDIHLQIPAGSVVAIVGPSGAGKSTFLKLMMCFYQPSSGVILLDNEPLAERGLANARSYISYVGQDTYLFSGTVRENLLCGRTDVSEWEILRAAKAANAHRFIMELPEAYDTDIGQNGAKLSGGQRQRIAIARAFIKNAPILLLDEPTSALDGETEHELREAFMHLQEGRTTLIVTHQLSTIQNADVILVMNHGRIVERGSSHQLLLENGLYARMYSRQLYEING